jgi:hypothetical protein
LYAQVAGNGLHIKKNKRKKKKCHWTYCESKMNDFDWGISKTSGYVCIEPKERPPLVGTTNEPAKADTTTTVSAYSDVVGNTSKKPQKEKLPKQKAAFILPAILRLRRRTVKKTAIK